MFVELREKKKKDYYNPFICLAPEKYKKFPLLLRNNGRWKRCLLRILRGETKFLRLNFEA